MSTTSGFVIPTYPYDRLEPIEAIAREMTGEVIDLSIGTPCDPPPRFVVEALSASDTERGYPTVASNAPLVDAMRGLIARRFGIEVGRQSVGVCIGTKEFVAGVPQWLKLRSPERDTVLYPSVAYPTYEMGALLASCRAVPVPVSHDGRLLLDRIDPADAERALVLWLNSPSNPTGALDDLDAAAAWGRKNGVPVFSDECYFEFTWDAPPSTILTSGLDGVIAVHSLSKRSNAAGLRVGFYVGDPDLVGYLVELRRHAGFMLPGPIQGAATLALGDDEHVEAQRGRYRRRLERLIEAFGDVGIKVQMPAGGFYLWIAAPQEFASEAAAGEGPEWGFARYLARTAGILVSPGEFYGPDGAGFVRIAVVAPDAAIELAASRLVASTR
ncbi:MAG TPA: aminotransferase class I/II-fold pyridoxal phosphate-dependent enzyme [Acidimicrobiales bacterium]|nr:aminotransferase class I/II-fold pyridoxal phosphate-dependent enzyme [Acidimicrobiales bacterium]